ncbi:hypothetical protein FDECE_5106 [Fusarium decemcellulare]|nr:hypothetical protein FDECE_5106 [Fusarium decemcellulare]
MAPGNVDLWNAALQSLPETSRSLLLKAAKQSTVAPVATQDIVKETIRLAHEKRSECVAKGWVFRIKGKEIRPRELFDKIINWLERFVAIGDVAVSFDPAHAALPWAAIRFLLQSAMLYKRQTESILKLVEQVSFLVQQGRFYEVTYSPATMDILGEKASESLSDLQADLTSLYSTILESLACVSRKIEQQSKGSQIVEAIFNPEEISDYLSQLGQQHQRVETRSESCHKAYNQEALHKLVKSCQEVDKTTTSSALGMISTLPYRSYHDEIQRLRTTDTCAWLLQDQMYRDWKQGLTRIAILYGLPGAGKTFLVSRVIDDLLSLSPSEATAHAVVYFYCNWNEEDCRVPENILRSFIRQLATPKAWLKSSSGELLDALDHIALETHQRAKFFISSRPDDDIRKHFQDHPKIEVEATCTQGDIATFVDRTLQQNKRLRSQSSELKTRIRDTLLEQNEGMFQWVALQLGQLARCVTSQHIYELLGKLPKGLDNTYRRIYDQIQEDPYKRGKVARVIQWLMCARTALTTYDIAIIMILDPMSDEKDSVEEELTSPEVISDMCCNLLRWETERQHWRFCHLSAREYFEKHHYSLRTANSFIAASCMKWLTQWPVDWSDEWDPPIRVLHFLKLFLGSFHENNRRSIGEYVKKTRASENLANFTRLRPASSTQRWYDQEELDLFTLGYREFQLAFGSSEQTTCSLVPLHLLSGWWMQTGPDMDPSKDWLNEWSPLASALIYDNISVWKHLLRSKVSVNTGRLTPLRAAIVRRNREAFDAILDAGANVNRCHWAEHRGCLAEAACRDDQDMMRVLLDRGADVNPPIKPSHLGYRLSPLMTACLCSKNVETVRFLVEHGASVNEPQGEDYIRESPLQAALERRQWAMAEILLDNGASIETRNPDKNILDVIKPECALSAAASNGWAEGFKFLIALGADINHNNHRSTPLISFCVKSPSRKHVEFHESLQMMLDAGADINGVCHDGYLASPLTAANATFRKLLVQAGAKIDLSNKRANPLCRAVKLEPVTSVESLLNMGANPNYLLEEQFGSALAASAYYGHVAKCKRLLGAGACPNSRLGGWFRNAIEAALCGAWDEHAQKGESWYMEEPKHCNIVQLLLKYGSDLPHAHDQEPRTYHKRTGPPQRTRFASPVHSQQSHMAFDAIVSPTSDVGGHLLEAGLNPARQLRSHT